jgi:hypothetical protein
LSRPRIAPDYPGEPFRNNWINGIRVPTSIAEFCDSDCESAFRLRYWSSEIEEIGSAPGDGKTFAREPIGNRVDFGR